MERFVEARCPFWSQSRRSGEANRAKHSQISPGGDPKSAFRLREVLETHRACARASKPRSKHRFRRSRLGAVRFDHLACAKRSFRASARRNFRMLRTPRFSIFAGWCPKRPSRLGAVHCRAPRLGETLILDPNWPKRLSRMQQVLQIAANPSLRRTACRRERSKAAKCCK